MRGRWLCNALLMAGTLTVPDLSVSGMPLGETQQQPSTPGDSSENALIEDIKRLSSPGLVGFSEDQPVTAQLVVKRRLLDDIDVLLSRYPKTSFRDEALLIKLSALADLARVHPTYLEQLLALTFEISRDNPKGRLASENAFFGIQAFVLGARVEKMPERRRLLGTKERYEAFLSDYPTSPRVPVVSASLVRNLIALDEIDRARAVFDSLKRAYPEDRATRRAQGELYRVVAIGQPFSLAYTAGDGSTIRSTDYLGKVLVLHFWSTSSEPSMAQLPELIKLHHEFAERGLQLLGVNVDRKRASFDKTLADHDMPWPQYFDGKGFENDLLVATGVLTIPTVFVVDRKGVLRAAGSGENLRKLVTDLIAPK